jgi:hypothetical protein
MEIVKCLLQGASLPRMAEIWQSFHIPKVFDIAGLLSDQLAKPGGIPRRRCAWLLN